MMHMIKHHRYRQHQGNIRRVENVDNVGIAHERYRLVNRRDYDAVDAAPEIEHIKDSGVSVEDVTLDDTDTITKG